MDFLLKQRLVGAIVLVALGVIFIPMLLEGPNRNLVPEMEPLPEPQERRLSQPLGSFPAPGSIPDEPGEQVLNPEPLAAPPVETAENAKGAGGDVTPGLETPLALPEPSPVKPDAVPEPVKEAVKTPPKEVVKTAPKDPGPLGNWVVQVGSFSSEENALRLRDKLRGGGFATQVEKVVLADKAHYRVRVGPYLKREQAERDLEKLTRTFALKGRVLSYP